TTRAHLRLLIAAPPEAACDAHFRYRDLPRSIHRRCASLAIRSVAECVAANDAARYIGSQSHGCYLAGIALVIFTSVPGLAAEWRLLIVTGLLGGLTAFSAFSAEVAALLLQGRLAAEAVAISAHVGGSLLMTMADVGTVMLIQRV